MKCVDGWSRMGEETREMNPSFNFVASPGTISQNNGQAVIHLRVNSFPMNGLSWIR